MKRFKRLLSLMLAALFVFSAAAEALPSVFAASPTQTVSATGEVTCNVKFSKPAICCDVGQTVNLSGCGVQFSASSGMTTGGITWTYNGKSVTTFTPSARGVYTLTAKSGSNTKTIYVVAKNADEEEYVLYRNDFDTAPSDFRVIETKNGGSAYVSNGAYVVDATAGASNFVRVLLPAFLDDFGDAKMEAGLKITSAIDSIKWGSMMVRVQNGNYPYYQSCLRYDMTASDGVEISQRNASDKWEVYATKDFHRWYVEEYNVASLTMKGTQAVLNLNGYDVLTYSNMSYANGAFGFQARGSKVMVDYVRITLDGNEPATTSCDVSFAKPAIRADIGQTVDLKSCDVQFAVDTVYTSGSSITWKKSGSTITTFTPTAAGVTQLTATSGGKTKTIYVVTRNLTDGEYVLYRNDFDSAPTDYRIVQQDNASFYHDGAGNFVIDASANTVAYGRILLPTYLDDFGDFKFEARYKESNQRDQTCWASLMGRIQNSNYPYMQMCVRYNAALENGVEFAQRNESDKWSVKTAGSYGEKTSGGYNTYAINMQSNKFTGYINGDKVVSSSQNLYVTGAMGLQAKGLKITVDYVKVTLGETTAQEDTAVKCAVSKTRPAIGCNAGQTILLNECKVQFEYGFPAVAGSEILWKKDGQVITEFSATTLGTHKLTATHAGTTMNVYVFAKKSTANEFVIYENDFSKAPTDFRVPEASNGGSCYQQNGYFVLNGSSAASSYVRVLLPTILDEFGDARLHTAMRLTAPVNGDQTKWGSIMYRVQNGNYPYLQTCMRYNTALENGVEISQRNANYEWEVYNSAPTGAMYSDGFNEVMVDTYCKSTILSINGGGIISYDNTPYFNGAWGFQVRGLTMMIDWVRVIFTNNNSELALYVTPGHYTDVRDPSTGMNIAPTMVSELKTMADFENIMTDRPAVAIMKLDLVDGEPRIVFNDGSVSPDTALRKLAYRVIPAFRIDSNAEADSLARILAGHDMRDAYVVSTDPAVVNRAYSNWKYARGVVDYSALTSFNAEDVRYEARANGARVVILPETVSKADVTVIQDGFSCVWIQAGEGLTSSVAAINKGPYGIITPNRTLTNDCYSVYYPNNTMIRRTNVIGHRGNPSVAQENTVAGALTAYANGATAVENDFYLVRDGVLMVMHDKTIDRTTNGSGNTVDFTSTQLKQYVVDYNTSVAPQPIPSLEEFFQAVKGDPSKRLVVEIKHTNTDFVPELKRLIEKYDILDQMVIIAFDENNIVALRQAMPGVAAGLLNYLTFDETDPARSTQNALETVQNNLTNCNPKYTDWGRATIQEMVYRGVTMWPWTINDQNTFDKLMVEGVGGITTNYSQWSLNYVENLTVNSSGRVMANTYGGSSSDVTSRAEFVVVEDTLGITYSNGTVKVPVKHNGGSASYFFRYKSTTPTGLTYYTVSDVITIPVQEHDYKTVVTAPTCTKGGYTTYTCSCGDSYVGNETAALGHNYKSVVKAPTCTDKGYTTYTCSRCNDSYVDNETVATGHSYKTVTVDATCDKAGSKTHTCSTCGHKNVETIPALGHNYKAVVTAPTCTEKGYTTHTCANCNNSYTDTEVAAKGHSYKTTTVDATCDKTGSKTYTCSACGHSYVENIAATGHSYTSVVTAPTCTEKGYTTYTCSKCQHSYVDNYVNAKGHTEKTVAGKAATCETTGLTDGEVCSVCDKVLKAQTTIAATGHKEETVAGKEATCETTGLTDGKICSVCDKVLKAQTTIAATGHTEKTVAGKAATCETTGLTDGKICSVCDKVLTAQQTIPAKGHTEKTLAYKAPTCTEAGITQGTQCSVCDKILTAQETIPATGHTKQTVAGKAATCTETGLTDGEICSVCNVTLTAQTTIPAKGHNYASVVTDPTCTTEGYTTNTCTVCGHSYVSDHKAPLNHSYTSVVTAPTCTEKGYTTYTCSRCSDSYVGNETAATGHSYKDVTVDATCEKDGSTTHTCSNCGHSYVDTIPAIGHDYKSAVTKPTCTEGGYTTYTCANCDHSYTADQVAATGHNYKTVTVDATCTADGSKTDTCENCGDVIVETIKATGHDYKSQVTAPTCTEAGYTTYTCACGHSYIADEVAAIGHHYKTVIVDATCEKDGSKTQTCENCGDVIAETIKAIGHDYKSVVTAPTCTEAGYTTYTCACGNSYVGDYTAPLNHSYLTQVTAPTCTEKGYTTYTCNKCGVSFVGNEVAATGHTEVAVSGKAPTCTEPGVSEGTVCAVCDKVLTAQGTTPATGHNYESKVTAPTCTEEGYTTYTCANCGDVYTDNKVDAIGHNYKTVTVDATCTADGSKTDTCENCGDVIVETIKATGHDYKSQVTAPTCTEAGYTTYTCANCDHSYIADEVAAIGHNYKTVTVDATCTADGSKTDTCENCGDVIVETIKATGHDYKSQVTAPTCTEAGYTTYTCANCDHSYTADEVVAIGHNYKTVIVDATCTADGSKTDTCENCGDVIVETIKAIGHDYKSVVTAPTCTEAGYTTYTCANCNHSYTADEVAATGHNYKSVVTAPTCTQVGYTTYTCTCGHSYIADQVAPTGHNYKTEIVDATCTTDGSKTQTCANCGDVIVEVIKATGHSHNAVVTAPTCTEAGYTTYTCACGDSYIGDYTAPLNHSYTGAVTAPTCTEAGYTTYTCTKCGDSFVGNEVAATGHSYENGKCTVCGAEDPDYVPEVKPSVVPTLTAKYPTVSFEDVIILNIYFDAKNTQDVKDMGLLLFPEKYDAADMALAEEVIPGYVWNAGAKLYTSSTNGIPAKELGKTIYFAVYAELADGTYAYSMISSYSVEKYAKTQLTSASTTAEMKALMVATLNYAAAAQVRFDYNADTLVNASLTEADQALNIPYSADMITAADKPEGAKLGDMVKTGNYKKFYPTVSFEGAFSINYYFQPTTAPVGDITMYVWTQADYDAAESLSKENASYALTMERLENGEYRAIVENIAAKQLNDALYVSICYNDGTTDYCSGVTGYSIGLYCKSQAAKTGAMAELAKATAVYGYYAKQRFG